MATMQNSQTGVQPVKPVPTRQLLLQLTIFFLLLGGALFLSAGRLDWAAGWAFLIAYLAFVLVTTLWMGRRDPGLLVERANAESGKVHPVERIFFMLARIGAISLYVTAGLDAGRFGWSSVPAGLRVLGWVMGLVGAYMIFWVMRTNTFASAVVRLQSDRGHRVVEDGPYRFVRHPMYFGNLNLFLGLPLLLGSWWAFIPAVALALTFVFRAAMEDRFLHKNLAGYAGFATRTRYRLIPGVW